MQSARLRVKDFRVIRQLDFSPEGFCLLVGANGSGKSTLLMILEFLQAFFKFGHSRAFEISGLVSLQNRDADPDDFVEISIEICDIEWKLQLPMSSTGIRGNYGEVISHAGKVMLKAEVFEYDWITDGNKKWKREEIRCGANFLWNPDGSSWINPLAKALRNIRSHGCFSLHHSKKFKPLCKGDYSLDSDGSNLWSVLGNWKFEPMRCAGLYDWVIEEARKAFPDVMGEVEFNCGFPYLYPPNAKGVQSGLFPNRVADGLLIGLLQLTAIAGAPDGSIIAMDNFESQLHPHAIRSLISAMRKRAEERNLTVILTTHSPVVINEFQHEPENVYVLNNDSENQIRRLTELRDEDALAQVSLGHLYESLDFGAPNISTGPTKS